MDNGRGSGDFELRPGCAPRLTYGQPPSHSWDVPTLTLSSRAPRGILPIRGAMARGHSAECPCLWRRAFRVGTSSPRMPPSALRGGSVPQPCGLPLSARNVPTLTPPSFVPPGVTSNKGGRSLVLTNSGPLRPPIRRTSAPLRCSSSPNGNGRFRWERLRPQARFGAQPPHSGGT